LPEFFEDNIKRWMDPFYMLIVTDLSQLIDKVKRCFVTRHFLQCFVVDTNID